MSKRYVAMKLQLWPELHALTPAPQQVGGCGLSAGCLLVYNTIEELEVDHGKGCHYIMITERQDGKTTNIQTHQA